MALPTLTSNSPVGGSIAWTAFGIQFDGVSYPISAGNTPNKFVWWEFATKTVKTANTLPTLLDQDMLLFLNKNGVGVLVPMTDVLDGSLIVPQSIYANAIAADQIDATHIKSGGVDADSIAAGAVTTEKLTVGSVGDNLVTNGSFEEFANGIPLGWMVEAGTCDVVTGVSSSGAYAARLVVPTTTSAARLSQSAAKMIPVTASTARSWYIAARVGAGTAITSGFYLQAQWYDASKVFISRASAVSNVAVGTSWTLMEGQVTPPSNARYMQLSVICQNPNVATNIYIDEVTAREVVVAAQIGNGQIVTAHMTANSINADRLVANSITANQLSATSIDGKTINGATIIGGEVKTSGTAGTVVGRMGPSAIKDAVTGSATSRPGIGFVLEGSTTTNSGMFSTDGDNLYLQGGNGGAGAMNYVEMKNNAINMYSYSGPSIASRGVVSIEGGQGGAAALAGVYIKGSYNQITGPVGLYDPITARTVDLDANVSTNTQFTFSNGWSHFGGGYGNFQIKEIAPGVILLEGMPKAGTKTDGITIGVLPAQFRPNRSHNLPCVIRTLTTAQLNEPGLLAINANGNVNLYGNMGNMSYAVVSVTYFLNSP